MSFLLDTNICVNLLQGKEARLRDRLLGLSSADVRLCSIVKAELLYGARNSQKVDANLKKLVQFFEPLASLPFDDAAATWYGVIRAQLRRGGSPIGGNDLMIASIALAADLTLVTRNQAELERVPGLRVEAGRSLVDRLNVGVDRLRTAKPLDQ